MRTDSDLAGDHDEAFARVAEQEAGVPVQSHFVGTRRVPGFAVDCRRARVPVANTPEDLRIADWACLRTRRCERLAPYVEDEGRRRPVLLCCFASDEPGLDEFCVWVVDQHCCSIPNDPKAGRWSLGIALLDGVPDPVAIHDGFETLLGAFALARGFQYVLELKRVAGVDHLRGGGSRTRGRRRRSGLVSWAAAAACQDEGEQGGAGKTDGAAPSSMGGHVLPVAQEAGGGSRVAKKSLARFEPIRPLRTTVLSMEVTDVPDLDLVGQVADRSEDALETLYRRHAPWLISRLRRRCADPEIVADVLQDTFVAAWAGAEKFRGDGEVAAWLWGIAVRRLVSRIRVRSGARATLGPALLDHDAVDVAAEELILLAVEYSDVGSALSRLSPELRTVLQATVLDGLTTREASQLLGIPQGTVKTRLVRARVRLREELA